MRRIHPWLSKVLYYICGLAAVNIPLCLLAYATASRLTFLTIDPQRLHFFCGMSALALTLLAILCFSAARVVPYVTRHSLYKLESIPGEKRATSRLWITLQILLSVAIFSQTVLHRNAPLDWDELDTATRLGTPSVCPIDDKNPYQNSDLISPTKNTRNHALANVAVVAAYRIFGVSEKIARLPALVFTLLFLIAIFLSTREVAPPAAIAFLLGHLALNGLFLWYAHSLRGYISMELFTFLALMELTKNPSRRASPWLYCLFIAFASVTHTFGALFCLLLFSTHLIWTAWYAPSLNASDLNFHLKRLAIAILCAPFLLWILSKQFLFLNHIGYLNTVIPVEKAEALASAWGITLPFGTFLVILVFIAAFLAHWINRRGIDLIGLHLIFSLFVLTLLITLLKATLFESRFLLAFIPPAVLWIATAASEMSFTKARITLWSIAFVVFLLLPWQGRREIYESRTQLMGGYGKFMTQVAAKVPRTEAECIRFSGEADQVMFSRGLYYPVTGKDTACRESFHVSFAKSWKGKDSPTLLEAGRWMTIIDDGEGRTLSQKMTAGAPLAFSEPNDLDRR